MNCAVERYALYRLGDTVEFAGGVSGRACGGPSAAYNSESCASVNCVPLGSSGPSTLANTELPPRLSPAARRTDGFSQTDVGYLRMRSVGLDCAIGKCALRAERSAQPTFPTARSSARRVAR